MTLRHDDDPEFTTLIILPDRWPRAHMAVSSRNTLFLTWNETCRRLYSGRRFNQIIAMSPPVGEGQSAAWAQLSRHLIAGGIQIEM
jgi:hypothetical protein